MASTRCLLLGAIFLHLCTSIYASISSQEDTCLTGEGYEFDVFRYFVKVPRRSQLKSILSIEGPRLEGNNPSEPCFQFSGSSGIHVQDKDITRKIATSVCNENSLTVHGAVFFKEYEFGGTIVELFHHPNKTFLGLSVCRVNSEVTVTYLHNNVLKYVSFPFKFFTGKWYKVAAILCGNLVKVYVNCTQIGEKIIPLPNYCPRLTGLELVAGSGCLNEELFPCTSGFNGSLQSVGLQSGANGLGKICPQLKNKAQCPICGPFLTLLKKHNKLQKETDKLRSDLTNCTAELNAVNCTSALPKPCLVQNVTISDGTFIKRTDGFICYCRDSVAHCTHPSNTSAIQLPTELPTTQAPPTPATLEEEKCSEATYFGHTFSLSKGESRYLYTSDSCVVVTCSTLGSIIFYNQQITKCSNVSRTCSGDQLSFAICCGYCSACANVNCPTNSTCYNSTDNPSGYQCVCKSGLQLSSDGDTCNDIDECSIRQGQPHAHNCPSDATCVNTFGSFVCQCPHGFEMKQINNSPQCVDINECQTGGPECGPNSTCMNTNGDYQCICHDGYTLVGKNDCIAVCEKPCQSGALCTSPNICTCVPGFYGDQCEHDIDECANSSLNECLHSESICVNTHGGYFCSCRKGLQYDSTRKLCVDVNECTTGIHKCSNSRCYNEFGSYTCSCVGRSCKGHCMKDGQTIYDNQKINIGADGCDECICKEGILNCVRKTCNCNAPDVSLVCCPECHRNACHIGDMIIEKGDYYIDPSNRCVRKKCVQGSNGNCVLQDASIQCPSVSHCTGDEVYIPEGACCPVCPLPVSPVQCSCDHANNATCTQNNNCPQLDCPREELIYLPGQCCPVCHSSIVKELSCP